MFTKLSINLVFIVSSLHVVQLVRSIDFEDDSSGMLHNVVDIYRCYRGSYCLHHQGDDTDFHLMTFQSSHAILMCEYFAAMRICQ